MRDLYIKNGHGFIVMYSLTNHQTFQDITTMRNVISRVKGSQPVPILLVANKLDLECQREVSTEEGEHCVTSKATLIVINFFFLHFLLFHCLPSLGHALAEMWGCPFVEASAKSRTNVNEVFSVIVREMNSSNDKRNKKSRYCCCTIL
jgi:Ras-related protein Rap-2C